MKSIIVAYDKNYGIGANGDLLWQRDLPADLEHFKKLTTGQTVIMGSKTFESIGRPLPNRQNIVLTQRPTDIEGVSVVGSLVEAYGSATNDQIFVIGGGQTYKLALDDNSIDQILATEVDTIFPTADVFFPEIDKNIWNEKSREHHAADEKNKYAFDFVTYTKVTN